MDLVMVKIQPRYKKDTTNKKYSKTFAGVKEQIRTLVVKCLKDL